MIENIQSWKHRSKPPISHIIGYDSFFLQHAGLCDHSSLLFPQQRNPWHYQTTLGEMEAATRLRPIYRKSTDLQQSLI